MAGARAGWFRGIAPPLLGLAGLLALVLSAAPAPAQEFSLGSGSQVRTLDQERMFQESRFGQRVTQELEEASRRLAEENRRLEAKLAAEERELAQRRAELATEEFRELADAFDERVGQIRRAQEEKNQAISRRGEAEQQHFFDAAVPVLRDLLERSGAAVILDTRAVIISSRRIDITDEAIVTLDAALGDGPANDVPPLPEFEAEAPEQEGDADAPAGPPLELSAPEE